MKTRKQEKTVKKRAIQTNHNNTFKKKLQNNIGKLSALKDPQLLEKIGLEQAPCNLVKTIIAASAKNHLTIQLKDLVTSTPHYTKCVGERFFESATSSFLSPIQASHHSQHANQQNIGNSSDSSEIRNPKKDNNSKEQNSSIIYIGTDNINSENVTLRKSRKDEGKKKYSPDNSLKRSRTVDPPDRHLVKKSKIPLRSKSQEESMNTHEAHKGESVPRPRTTPSTKGQTSNINKKSKKGGQTVRPTRNHEGTHNNSISHCKLDCYTKEENVKKSILEASKSKLDRVSSFKVTSTENLPEVNNGNEKTNNKDDESVVGFKSIGLSPITGIDNDKSPSKIRNDVTELPPKEVDSIQTRQDSPAPVFDLIQEIALRKENLESKKLQVEQGQTVINNEANDKARTSILDEGGCGRSADSYRSNESDKGSFLLDVIEAIKIRKKNNATGTIRPRMASTSSTEGLLTKLISDEKMELRKQRWDHLLKAMEDASGEADQMIAEGESNKNSKSNNLTTKSLVETAKPRKSMVTFMSPRRRSLPANDASPVKRSTLRRSTRRTVNKRIQTSYHSNRVSGNSRPPVFRRSAFLRGSNNLSSAKINGYESLSSSTGPNIFDSLEEGNELDALLFSDVNVADLSFVEKPWRFENDRASLEPLSTINLNFIRSEGEISYSNSCKTASEMNDNSSQGEMLAKRRISLANVSSSSKHSRRTTRSKSYIARKRYEKKNNTAIAPTMEDVQNEPPVSPTNLSTNASNHTKPKRSSDKVEESGYSSNTRTCNITKQGLDNIKDKITANAKTRITQYGKKSKPLPLEEEAGSLVIKEGNLDTTVVSPNKTNNISIRSLRSISKKTKQNKKSKSVEVELANVDEKDMSSTTKRSNSKRSQASTSLQTNDCLIADTPRTPSEGKRKNKQNDNKTKSIDDELANVDNVGHSSTRSNSKQSQASSISLQTNHCLVPDTSRTPNKEKRKNKQNDKSKSSVVKQASVDINVERDMPPITRSKIMAETSAYFLEGTDTAANASPTNSKKQKDATFLSPGDVIVKKRASKKSSHRSFANLYQSNIIQTEGGSRPQRTRRPFRGLSDIDIEKLGLIVIGPKKRLNTTKPKQKRTKRRKKTDDSNTTASQTTMPNNSSIGNKSGTTLSSKVDDLLNSYGLQPIEESQESAIRPGPSREFDSRCKELEAQDKIPRAKTTKSNPKRTKMGKKSENSSAAPSQISNPSNTSIEKVPEKSMNSKAKTNKIFTSNHSQPLIEDSQEADSVFQDHIGESAIPILPGPSCEAASPFKESEAQNCMETRSKRLKTLGKNSNNTKSTTTKSNRKRTKKAHNSDDSDTVPSQSTKPDNSIGNKPLNPKAKANKENHEPDPVLLQDYIEDSTNTVLPELFRKPNDPCGESGVQNATNITDKGSKMFDRNSNLSSAIQNGCSGSIVNSYTDFDSITRRSSVLTDNNFVQHIIAGTVYNLRFVSQIPSLTTFRKLGNLNVFQSIEDPDDRFTAGFMRLEANDRKRPTAGHKYSFIYNVISGTAQVQLNGKKAVAKPGNFFYVPRGMTYSIVNPSLQRDLLLSYTRIRGEEK